jgi:murein DD-endopeptidase MepM/ murein hydrolase activator NlpD
MPPSGEPQQDSLSEPVPTDVVVVPPPTTPIPVNPVTPLAQETARVTVQGLNAEVAKAAAAQVAAAQGVERATSEVALLEARLATLAAEERERAARLVVAKERVKKMAVARYVATPTASLNDVLESGSFTEGARRLAMLAAVAASDQRRIAEHDAAERDAGTEVRQVLQDLDRARASLTAASAALEQANAELAASTGRLAAAEARSALVAGGFLFPVAGRHSYTDTFGAPRMFGTAFAHLHEGTDIFALSGTPLVAVERGVLIKVGVAGLGGVRLWLVGASGTRYYYAHLSGFAPGAADGKVVEAGEVVGYVGNTGNAVNTPSHLHFEVHPGGGPAVNPYPLLRIVDGAQARLTGAPAPKGRAK